MPLLGEGSEAKPEAILFFMSSFFRNFSISKLYLFIACLAGLKIGVKLCVCDGYIDGYSESVLISKAARGVQSGLDRSLKDSVSL